MGGFSFGHVGAWDVPISDIDPYAATDINLRDLPFADTTPAPATDAHDYCSCGNQRQTDGRCWRCDIGCSRCGGKLDREGFCSMCGATSLPVEEREAA